MSAQFGLPAMTNRRTARPILYSFRRCPYAMRARLALLRSGTVCELREVKLSAKPPEMIAASAKATVPILVLPDGRVIDESLDIMHWALERQDPGRWLDTKDADCIAVNDGAFKDHLDRYKYCGHRASDASLHRAAAMIYVQSLDARLASKPWLGGPAPGLTDVAIMPFVRQFAQTDRPWFDSQALAYVHVWLAEWLASSLFQAAMLRVPPWKPGEEPVLFGAG